MTRTGIIVSFVLAVLFAAAAVVAFIFWQQAQDLRSRMEKSRAEAEIAQNAKKNLEKQVTGLRRTVERQQSEIYNQQRLITDLEKAKIDTTGISGTLEAAKAPTSRSESEARQQLVAALDDAFKNSNYEVYSHGPYTVVRVPDSEFAYGSSRPSANLVRQLKYVSNVINNFKEEYCVIVEGHTDNTAVRSGSKIGSNRELGAKRSLRVVNALESFNAPPGNVVVASWGEYLPVVEHEKATRESKNRRVELVFAPKRVVQQGEVRGATGR